MTTREFRITGWHVLTGLVLFFGLMLIANTALVVAALKTHPGEDEPNSYAQGLDYNRELQEKRAQQKLGWQALVAVKEDASGVQTIDLAFKDKTDAPVLGLRLEAALRNPVDEKRDRALVFQPIGPGLFRASFPNPEDAQWDLLVTARSDMGEVFRLRHRL